MRPSRPSLLLRLSLAALLLGLAPAALAQPAPPPLQKELQALGQIQDPEAQLKELERLWAAHPAPADRAQLGFPLAYAKGRVAPTLEAVLAAQKPGIESARGMQRITAYGLFATQLMEHPKAAGFDKGRVLAAVLAYREQARKDGADAAVLEAAGFGTRDFIPMVVQNMDLQVAKAQLAAGKPGEALASLDAYQKAGGALNAAYQLARADVLEAMDRPAEAYEAVLLAALDGHKEGLRRTRSAYAKTHGGDEKGLDAMLEAKGRELPFHPAPFRPEAAWKGRAVLAELFTGSECPPCAAADLAFDGLLESHPATALVVLEYHLPIPGPDPMMNAATRRRQEYYGVNSTPTVLLDGTERVAGGGPRSAAGQKYALFAERIARRLEAAPGAALNVSAALKGDRVEAAVDLGKPLEGVDYHLVLVQGQQEHKGGNRIQVHKMVVRDFLTLDPSAQTVAFDLAASEKATDAYLTEFEQTSTRFKGFRFPLRRHLIGRVGLKVALLAQRRDTKAVLQAVLAEVK